MRNQELINLANGISNKMFADSPSLPEAFKYAESVINASENPGAMWTVVFVIMNTLSKEMKSIANND